MSNSTNALKHKVFVYGTLKTGEPNHHWFTKESKEHYNLIGEATTVQKYPLVIGTQYNIPFLLDSPGTGKNVRGELYEVDDKLLVSLDELEEHPNFYVREKRDVTYNLNGRHITEKAWIYLIKTFTKNVIEQEHLECYSNKGSHNRRYNERYLHIKVDDWKSEVFKNSSENATLDDLNSS